MNTGSYTGIASPELAALLDKSLSGIAAEIEELKLPGLACVVLGGGYGRGEGGVRHTPEGDRLYNDLDFFVFTDGTDGNTAARIGSDLKKISERWEPRLGIAVDFGPAKNLSAAKNSAHTLMFQELVRGWKPVWGSVELGNYIPLLDAAMLPVSEAIRLLLNRGMGLIFAGQQIASGKPEPDFTLRNINKAVLGAADALLLCSGRYRWKGPDRVAAFREYVRDEQLRAEYADDFAAAFRYKLEPDPVLPADPLKVWRKARRFYLDAVRKVADTAPDALPEEVKRGLHHKAASERSVKNFLRWVIKARSLRSPRYCMDAPVVTVLGIIYKLLSEHDNCPDCPERLYRLWTKFN